MNAEIRAYGSERVLAPGRNQYLRALRFQGGGDGSADAHGGAGAHDQGFGIGEAVHAHGSVTAGGAVYFKELTETNSPDCFFVAFFGRLGTLQGTVATDPKSRAPEAPSTVGVNRT
jgi:hypothetical protein